MHRVMLVLATCELGVVSGCSSSPPVGADPVILIHGLGRSPASMAILGNRLEGDGYRVMRFGYPSTTEPLDALVANLQAEVERCCGADAETVHFVTHTIQRGDHHRRPKSEPSDLVAHSWTGRRQGGCGSGAARRSGRFPRPSCDAHIHHEPVGRS